MQDALGELFSNGDQCPDPNSEAASPCRSLHGRWPVLSTFVDEAGAELKGKKVRRSAPRLAVLYGKRSVSAQSDCDVQVSERPLTMMATWEQQRRPRANSPLSTPRSNSAEPFLPGCRLS